MARPTQLTRQVRQVRQATSSSTRGRHTTPRHQWSWTKSQAQWCMPRHHPQPARAAAPAGAMQQLLPGERCRQRLQALALSQLQPPAPTLVAPPLLAPPPPLPCTTTRRTRPCPALAGRRPRQQQPWRLQQRVEQQPARQRSPQARGQRGGCSCSSAAPPRWSSGAAGLQQAQPATGRTPAAQAGSQALLAAAGRAQTQQARSGSRGALLLQAPAALGACQCGSTRHPPSRGGSRRRRLVPQRRPVAGRARGRPLSSAQMVLRQAPGRRLARASSHSARCPSRPTLRTLPA
jgi:hypothetical protein